MLLASTSMSSDTVRVAGEVSSDGRGGDQLIHSQPGSVTKCIVSPSCLLTSISIHNIDFVTAMSLLRYLKDSSVSEILHPAQSQ